MLGRTITHTVSLVLALRNSWNDKLIGNSGFSFEVDNISVFPIRKACGYYVFIDLEKSKFDLKITCKDFYEEVIHIDLDQLKEPDHVLELPLKPKFLRGQPLNCGSFFGKADPNVIVGIIKDSPRAQLKLVKSGGKQIEISNALKLNILGSTLAVFDPSKSDFEVFYVVKRNSYEEYEIDHEFKTKFDKDSFIVKAYTGRADTEGNFNVFVNYQNENRDFILKTEKNGQQVIKKIKLEKVSEAVMF